MLSPTARSQAKQRCTNIRRFNLKIKLPSSGAIYLFRLPTFFDLVSTTVYIFASSMHRWPSGQPWLWRTTEIIVIHRLTDSESDESSSSPSSSTDKSPSSVFGITWQRFRFSSQVARMFSFPSKESLRHVADAQLTRCKSPRISDSDARSMRSVYRKE